MRIGPKLMLSFAVVGVVPILIALAIIQYSIRPSYEQVALNGIQSSVDQSAKAIDEFIRASIEDFRIISVDPALYVSSPQEASQHLQLMVKRAPTYNAFYIADRSGQIRASSNPAQSDKNILDLLPDIQPQFRHLLDASPDEVVTSDATILPPQASDVNRPIMTGLSIKVLGGLGGGKREKLLIGVVYLPNVENLVRDLDDRTGGNEHAYLLNSKGQVLATEDPSIKFPNIFPDFVNAAFRKELESRQSGTYVYRNAERRQMICGFSRVARYGPTSQVETWWLISTAPYNEVMAEIRRLFSYTLAAVMAVGGFMIFVAIYVSRTISKPILYLAEASRQIGSGETSKIFVYSKDEIGDLASAFRSMATNLAATHASLQAEIEERRQIIHALRESEEKYRSIIENIQDGYFEVNRNGELTFYNESFASILRRPAGELTRLADPRLMDEKNVKKVNEGFRQVYESGQAAVEFDFEIKIADGTTRVVEASIGPSRDPREEIIGCRGIIRDVTERKRAEEQLKAALKMQSDFVSFVSHQLRTPLAGIKWLLELALDNTDMSSETRSFVEDGHRSAQRLAGLVSDLLDVARLERGAFRNEPQETDIGDLTRSVLQEVQPLIQSKSHEVMASGLDSVPNVMIDPQLFRQVILNLVSNAIKYTPARGKITVRAQTENHTLHWEIQDSGIGIPRTAQARLFEKFYRADNAVMVETEGTGLGLYLVRLIVEKSGGRVWCESEETKGSKFSFSLPQMADNNHDNAS